LRLLDFHKAVKVALVAEALAALVDKADLAVTVADKAVLKVAVLEDLVAMADNDQILWPKSSTKIK
jgi:hypothetical protein